MGVLDSLTPAQKIVLVLAIAVLLIGFSIGGHGRQGSSGQAGPSPAQYTQPAPVQSAIVVHVVGEVRTPGVYRLPAGARVMDAISAAGGFTNRARPESVNLAAFCEDGDQIRVDAIAPRETTAVQAPAQHAPSEVGTAASPSTTASPTTRLPAPPTPSPAQSRSNAPAAQAPTGARPQRIYPIRLNYAGPEELEQIPGIGPELARRIIYYRALKGPFRSFSQLEEIDGIGPETIAKIRTCATLY